jgi:hypothetical protein
MYWNFLTLLTDLFYYSQTIHFRESLLDGHTDLWLLSVLSLLKLQEIVLIIWVENESVCLLSCTTIPPQSIQAIQYLGIKFHTCLWNHALTLFFCLGVIKPRNKIYDCEIYSLAIRQQPLRISGRYSWLTVGSLITAHA